MKSAQMVLTILNPLASLPNNLWGDSASAKRCSRPPKPRRRGFVAGKSDNYAVPRLQSGRGGPQS